MHATAGSVSRHALSAPIGVVCLLGDDRWRLVASSLYPPLRAQSGKSLIDLIETGRFGVILIDPNTIRGDLFDGAARATQRVGGTMYILAILTRLSATSAVRASELVPTEISWGVASDNALVRKTLQFGSISTPAWLLHYLAPRIQLLPSPIRVAIAGLFGGREIPLSVQAFANTAGMGRRSLERHLDAIELSSVKRVLDAVRVARAWDALAETPRSLQEISDEVGFLSVRTLADQFTFFVGASPRRSVDRFNTSTFAAQLAARLLQQDLAATHANA